MFLRPYLRYSSLPHVENSASANYNGLQVGLNRRFSCGVLFGVAYTWSKNLGYASADFDTLPRYVSRRVWTYGPTFFDQTHMFVVNYVWTLPKATKLLPTRWSIMCSITGSSLASPTFRAACRRA